MSFMQQSKLLRRFAVLLRIVVCHLLKFYNILYCVLIVILCYLPLWRIIIIIVVIDTIKTICSAPFTDKLRRTMHYISISIGVKTVGKKL